MRRKIEDGESVRSLGSVEKRGKIERKREDQGRKSEVCESKSDGQVDGGREMNYAIE